MHINVEHSNLAMTIHSVIVVMCTAISSTYMFVAFWYQSNSWNILFKLWPSSVLQDQMFAVFPLIFYVVFLLCFSSSCVHYVASFSGLSIFDYPFGNLLRLLYQCYKPDQVILNTTWDDLYSVLDLIIFYCDFC